MLSESPLLIPPPPPWGSSTEWRQGRSILLPGAGHGSGTSTPPGALAAPQPRGSPERVLWVPAHPSWVVLCLTPSHRHLPSRGVVVEGFSEGLGQALGQVVVMGLLALSVGAPVDSWVPLGWAEPPGCSPLPRTSPLETSGTRIGLRLGRAPDPIPSPPSSQQRPWWGRSPSRRTR